MSTLMTDDQFAAFNAWSDDDNSDDKWQINVDRAMQYMTAKANRVSNYFITNTSSTTSTYINTGTITVTGTGGGMIGTVDAGDFQSFNKLLKISAGQERIIELPDGTKINVDEKGNFSINDKDSKVTYKSNNVREFNKYMNASDLIEQFIADLGKLGVTQGQLLKIPINVFFVWLVHKAAEADGETPANDVPKLEALPEVTGKLPMPQCRCCGKFITRQKFKLGVNFCNADHMTQHMDRQLVRV